MRKTNGFVLAGVTETHNTEWCDYMCTAYRTLTRSSCGVNKPVDAMTWRDLFVCECTAGIRTWVSPTTRARQLHDATSWRNTPIALAVPRQATLTRAGGTAMARNRANVSVIERSDQTAKLNKTVASRCRIDHTKRRVSTKRFRFVELNRDVSQPVGVITTLCNWCRTDLVSFSSSRRTLDISDQLLPVAFVFKCRRLRATGGYNA